jgi:hypothetical protein
VARLKYEELMGVKVQETGLTIMAAHHYLAASSDGLVCSTVIEIKCPFSGQNKTIRELVDDGYSHIYEQNGIWQINNTSHYYCQIQGEMAIKNCSLCHFVVWTTKDIVIVHVNFDRSFWEQELLPKLILYFETTVKPKLLAAD